MPIGLAEALDPGQRRLASVCGAEDRNRLAQVLQALGGPRIPALGGGVGPQGAQALDVSLAIAGESATLGGPEARLVLEGCSVERAEGVAGLGMGQIGPDAGGEELQPQSARAGQGGGLGDLQGLLGLTELEQGLCNEPPAIGGEGVGLVGLGEPLQRLSRSIAVEGAPGGGQLLGGRGLLGELSDGRGAVPGGDGVGEGERLRVRDPGRQQGQDARDDPGQKEPPSWKYSGRRGSSKPSPPSVSPMA